MEDCITVRQLTRKRKVTLAIAAAGAITLGAASPALATRVNVGGGIWDYGTNSSYVWSYYLHNGTNHKTTVYNGSYHYSGCKTPGVWANVRASDRFLIADSSYWDYC